MMENHANHPKICHRGDGQCTCYYCTIFGHSVSVMIFLAQIYDIGKHCERALVIGFNSFQECSHGRTNETRDRLRKRLHQIQSKNPTKSHTVKTTGVLKRMLANKAPPGPSSSTSVGVTGGTIKANSEQKDNTKNESIAAKTHKLEPQTSGTLVLPGTIPKTASASTSTPANAEGNSTPNHPEIDEIFQALKNIQVDEKEQKPSGSAAQAPNSSTINSVRHASFCPISPSEMGSINDILDFIEGNTTMAKKDLQKKAAKKAKQKQKKEDVKKVEELEQLRTEFHELYFKEFDAKNELKTLKAVKKRDKKKVSEVENNLKKFGKVKSKLESSILERIFALKKNNSEFKFAYLPTKQQQLQRQAEVTTAASTTTPGSATVAASVPTTSTSSSSSSITDKSAQNGADGKPCDTEIYVDHSKRMVTIRRVNLPNAEPQVTITSKGPTSEKDKVFYTFVNGQFVRGKLNFIK